jgi:type II secretory pathway predicted ATPase ExeA
MTSTNPFRPTFGSSPPKLAGRDEDLLLFADAIDEGPGSPARSILVLGQRGTGKTVMLNSLEDVAKSHGWLTISDTAHDGMIHRVNDRVTELLHEHDADGEDRSLTSVSAPLGMGSISWATEEQYARVLGLRGRLTRLVDIVQQQGTGVFITVDEVHGSTPHELRELATIVQHTVREDRNLAFAVAGLPAAMSEVLVNDPVLTFLRRSERFTLGTVDPSDVRDALLNPIVDAGRTISNDALDAAVTATEGYPYMIQLAGYHAWRQHPDTQEISFADVEAAYPIMIEKLGSQVLDPALQPLSDIDRRFLAAMAIDDDDSRMSDIADRLGESHNYAQQYRRRLIDAEIITPTSRGHLTMALPGLRAHLRAKNLDYDLNDGIDI